MIFNRCVELKINKNKNHLKLTNKRAHEEKRAKRGLQLIEKSKLSPQQVH